MTDRELVQAYANLRFALDRLHALLGIDELHFAELLSGKRVRQWPLETRLTVFRLMAEFFARGGYPILVQTISPDDVAEHEAQLSTYPKHGPFSFTDPRDLAFILLAGRLNLFFAQHPTIYRHPAFACADEGRFRAGTGVYMGPAFDFAVDNAVFFRSSKEMVFLQLADFAAFAVNRQQWLMAKAQRTEADNMLLEILSEAHFNAVNLEVTRVDFASWTPADFDAFHERDRTAKGLSPLPGRVKRH